MRILHLIGNIYLNQKPLHKYHVHLRYIPIPPTLQIHTNSSYTSGTQQYLIQYRYTSTTPDLQIHINTFSTDTYQYLLF